MKEKLKEFYSKNKKKCVTALIVVVAGIFYCCFGSDLDQEKAVDLLCKILNCGE